MVQFLLTLFEYVPPVENIPADAVVMVVFILSSICFIATSAYYLRIKATESRFIYMFKPGYVILLTVSEVFSLFSIYITYGYMAQAFTDEMLQSACSLWTYWTMFILGLGLWIAILVNTIGNTALSIIGGGWNNITQRTARVLLLFICLIVYIVIGIMAQLLNLFRDDEGTCATHFSLKLINMAVVIAFLSIITAVGRWLQQHTLIDNEDKRGLLIEMSIVKHTWILFGVLIVLNIFSFTAYWPGRVLFAAVVIYIFFYTHLVYIITPIAHYHDFRYLSYFPQIFTIENYLHISIREPEDDGDPENGGTDPDGVAIPDVMTYTKDMYITNEQLTNTFLTSVFKLSDDEKILPRLERAYTVSILGADREYTFLANELISFLLQLKRFLGQLRLEPESEMMTTPRSMNMRCIDELFQLKDYNAVPDQLPMLNIFMLPVVATFLAERNKDLLDPKAFYISSCEQMYDFFKENIVNSLFDIWVETGQNTLHIQHQKTVSDHNIFLANSGSEFI